MYKLKYVSDNGKVLNFGPCEDLVITSETGLTGNNVNIRTAQSFSQLGTVIQGQSVQDHTIVLTGVINAKSDYYRQLLIEAIAPMVGGTLFYNDQIYKRVTPEVTPIISNEDYYAKFQFVLKSPYPYWHEIQQISVNLSGVVGGFKFPVNYKKHYFGWFISTLYANVINRGNAPIGFMVEFAARKTVKNPEILKISTNEKIKLLHTMQPNEKAYINTVSSPIESYSVLNGIRNNVIIDIDSDFFDLDIGDNLIKPGADSGLDGLSCRIVSDPVRTGAYGALLV